MLTIYSWNTRGQAINRVFPFCRDVFSLNNGSVVMIQEAGNVVENGVDYADGWHHQINFGTNRRPINCTARFFVQPDDGGRRCKTGMIIGNNLGNNINIFNFTQEFERFVMPALQDLPRPIVSCVLPYMHQSLGPRQLLLSTMHLTAHENIAIDQRRRLNQIFRNMFAGGNVDWLIIGDFNCQPVVREVDMRLRHPGRNTHERGGILDYVMCCDALFEYITVDIATDRDEHVPLGSDHFPIKCVIRDDFFNI